MAAKEIFYSDAARNALFSGVTKLADAVKVTIARQLLALQSRDVTRYLSAMIVTSSAGTFAGFKT